MKIVKVEDNKLYTPIIKYKRDSQRATALGMIHIGEQEYYDLVQKEIDPITTNAAMKAHLTLFFIKVLT